MQRENKKKNREYRIAIFESFYLFEDTTINTSTQCKHINCFELSRLMSIPLPFEQAQDIFPLESD